MPSAKYANAEVSVVNEPETAVNTTTPDPGTLELGPRARTTRVFEGVPTKEAAMPLREALIKVEDINKLVPVSVTRVPCCPLKGETAEITPWAR
jgi:hypothetical protein